jgi:hypothetical protein
MVAWMFAVAMAQGTVEVLPGQSVRDAIHGAASGATVVVHAGATTEGIAWVGAPKRLTVRSATDDLVEISGLRVHDGGELRLERVIVPTRSVGAQSRALTVQGGVLTGDRVALKQESTGAFGLFVGEGSVEIDRLVADGFRGQRPVWAEPQAGSRRVILNDCELTGNQAGVIYFRGANATGDELRLQRCLVARNASMSSSLVTIDGAGSVKIYASRFLDNTAARGGVEIVQSTAYLGVQTSVFCGASLPHLALGPADGAVIQRNVLIGGAQGAAPLVALSASWTGFVHNTLVGYPGATPGTVGLGYAATGGGTIANNLFTGLAATVSPSPTWADVAGNLVYDSGDPYIRANDPRTLTGDPLLVSAFDPTRCGSLPLLTDGSPAVDAGVVVPDLIDPVEDPGAPDIGALPLGSTPEDPDDPDDPLAPGDEIWVTGGCDGCHGSGGPAAWLGLLALLALRRRS